MSEATHEPNAGGVYPATRHYHRPLGFGVERVESEDGTTTWNLNFLITPMEVIIIEIADADKPRFLKDLTGGIDIVSAQDLPT